MNANTPPIEICICEFIGVYQMYVNTLLQNRMQNRYSLLANTFRSTLVPEWFAEYFIMLFYMPHS